MSNSSYAVDIFSALKTKCVDIERQLSEQDAIISELKIHTEGWERRAKNAETNLGLSDDENVKLKARIKELEESNMRLDSLSNAGMAAQLEGIDSIQKLAEQNERMSAALNRVADEENKAKRRFHDLRHRG